MPFTIRLEIKLNDFIDGKVLKNAVNKSIKKFPYFAVKVVKKGEEYVTEENSLPLVVYSGDKIFDLGSEKVNYHMLSVYYNKDDIVFFVSHVITDGGGLFPFVKTVLYFYLREKTGLNLQVKGIDENSDIVKDEILDENLENLINKATPFYKKTVNNCFKLEDGEQDLGEDKGKIFRFSIPLKETMAFSYDNDGSPNALLSSLMAKAIFKINDTKGKSIVSAVSFNMRGGLNNSKSLKLISSALKVEYPEKLKDQNILKLCTCTRGTISLQSQPENVLYEMKLRKKLFDEIKNMTLKEKKEFIGKKALLDATDNTFSISYVGKVDYGDLDKYILADYNITDGSTYKTLFIEIGAVKDKFTIAFIQGFSSDVYYKALIGEIKKCGIPVTENEVTDLITCGIKLP